MAKDYDKAAYMKAKEEEKTYQTEDERQTIEHVMSLVVGKFVRKVLQAIRPWEKTVDEWNTCNPVSVLYFSITLDVVLATCEVPHEVAPVHEVHLV